MMVFPKHPSQDPEGEGLFDEQLTLPLGFMPEPQPIGHVVKRDGRREAFDKQKIAEAIYKAAESVGGEDRDLANNLASAVTIYLSKQPRDGAPGVDHIHDAVERVLIQMAHAKTALAYARYRDRRARVRRLRQGDLRALLGELEEAREARAAAGAGAHALFVRTSADTVTTWDTARIVEALVQETGLERAMALVVALEVEAQLQAGQIKTLTTSLVRELVGAKLVEHGLEEYREKHRRLGVPLYDCARIVRGRTPETLQLDPMGTDQVLAHEVKKEYALAVVYSPAVTEAHLRGELHVHGLGQIDRLLSARHSLEYVVRHGIAMAGPPSHAEPPRHAHALLAQLVKCSELLRRLFIEPAHWPHLNVYFAPFVHGLSPQDLEEVAQMLVYEFAYQAAMEPEKAAPCIGLSWVIPTELRDETAWGPGAEESERTYGGYEHAAQKFAWQIVQALSVGTREGKPIAAPVVHIELNNQGFVAPGHENWLAHVAALAAAGGAVVFERESLKRESGEAYAPSVLQQVTLNLPLAGYTAGKEAALQPELHRLVGLAVEAHADKREFAAALMESAEAPLGLLGIQRDAGPYVALETAECRVAVEGLNECVQAILGVQLHESAEAMALGERVLALLQHACTRESERRGLRLVLTQNSDPAVGRRMAALDAAACPASAGAVLKQELATQAVTYTRGARLADGHGLSPMETLRMEGLMQARAAGMAEVALPHAETSAESVVGVVRKAWRETEVRSLKFKA